MDLSDNRFDQLGNIPVGSDPIPNDFVDIPYFTGDEDIPDWNWPYIGNRNVLGGGGHDQDATVGNPVPQRTYGATSFLSRYLGWQPGQIASEGFDTAAETVDKSVKTLAIASLAGTIVIAVTVLLAIFIVMRR